LFVLQRYPDYWVTLAILIGVVVLAVMYGPGIVARPKKP
jgi:hypothetical protein